MAARVGRTVVTAAKLAVLLCVAIVGTAIVMVLIAIAWMHT
jgi:hypothetical protein